MLIDVTRGYIEYAREYSRWSDHQHKANPVNLAIWDAMREENRKEPPRIWATRWTLEYEEETLWNLPSGVTECLTDHFKGLFIAPFSLLIPDRIWRIFDPLPIHHGLTGIGAEDVPGIKATP